MIRTISFLAVLAALTASAVHAQDPDRDRPGFDGDMAPPSDSGADTTAILKLRNIGPSVAGGRVASVVGVPGDPQVYYVGAGGGGVWKTTDAGATWKAIFEDQPDASIGAIALAPSNPSEVWVGTGEANPRNDIVNGHGVYVSPDGGQTWRFAGLKDAGQIANIVVDPNDPNTVWVAALGKVWAPNPDRGVFKTTDGGKTWKKVLFVNDTVGASSLVMEPGNPNVLYAAMWQMQRLPWMLIDGGKGSGIYRSLDGGDTWKKLTEGLPDGVLGRGDVAVAPSDPSRVYVLLESKKGSFWRSDDRGDHFTMVTDSHNLSVRPWYFADIKVAPDNPDRIYFASFFLMESDDGGKSAHGIDNDVHVDHHSIWIDPTNPKRILQGNDGGAYVSLNGGKVWDWFNNLPIGQFYMVAADARTPYRLCGGLQDNSGWCGPSTAVGRRGLSQAQWFGVVGGDGEYVVPAPSDSNIVYAESQNGYLERIDLRNAMDRSIRPYYPGVEAQAPSELKYRFNWTSPVAVSRTDANTVYLGANTLFKSTDGGQHWDVISPDLTRNDKSKQQVSGGPVQYDISGAETYNTILSITLAPSDSNVIWVGSDDGLLHYTRDGGKTWADATPHVKGVPEEGRIYQVGVSPFDPGTAYIALDRHEFADNHPYVLKTTDWGKSWSRIDKGLPDDYAGHVIREDPGLRNFLVLGTDNALYWSRDGGANWNNFGSAFPTAPVYDLKFVPGTHDLAVATHGRGLFVLDDVSPLEQLTPDVKSQAVALFPVPTATRWYTGGFDYTSPSRLEIEGAPTGAQVSYWLRDSVSAHPDSSSADSTKGGNAAASQGGRPGGRMRGGAGGPGKSPVTITVLDAKGDTMATQAGKGAKGINRWDWNLRSKGATPLRLTADTGGRGGGGRRSFGPAVLPGTYTVVLTVQGKSYQQPVTVRPDPRLPWDSTAARVQHDAAFRVQHDVSAMHEMLNGIHRIRNQIAGVQQAMRGEEEGQPGDTAVLNAARKLDGKFKALFDTMYNTEVQRGVPEDDIHYLTKFADKLEGLQYGVAGGYDEAPQQAAMDELPGMEKQLQGYLDQYNQLVAQDVTQFNQLANQHNAPVVVAGGKVEVKGGE